MTERSRIAAHRGGALEQPENTIAAFHHAVAIGADEVELDIHCASDGVIVVHHDATLERMTTGRGPVGAHDLAALQRFRIRGSEGAWIPTLEEVLAVIAPSPVTLRLEVKRAADGSPYPRMIERAIDLVASHGLENRFYVTGFHADDLAVAADITHTETGLFLIEDQTLRAIGFGGLSRVLDLAGTRNAALPMDAIGPETLDEGRRRGITISAFGCHSAAQIEKALALALPVFTSDRPSLALELRRKAETRGWEGH